MFEENMSSPKTPKTPQRRRLSLKEKIKIIEDCDETLCVKCFKAHSRLKLTRTHIVTPL